MVEKEYIDKRALLKRLCDDDPSHMEDYYYNAIAEAPAADVVEVCRCKDCKHYQPVTPTCGNCFLTTGIQRPKYFCSRGERKETES